MPTPRRAGSPTSSSWPTTTCAAARPAVPSTARPPTTSPTSSRGPARAGRHRRVHAAGHVPLAQDRRGEVQPGAGAPRQGAAGGARRRGHLQHARRRRAASGGTAGLRRPRPGHSRGWTTTTSPGSTSKARWWCYLSGSPSNVPGALSAHYQSAAERWSALQGARRHRHHHDPQSEGDGRAVGALGAESAQSVDGAGRCPAPTTPPGRRCRLPSTRRRPSGCSKGSGHTLAEVLKIADEGKALPHFPLPPSE